MSGLSGANALARTLQERLSLQSQIEKYPLDYGEIQEDMSLLLNRFPLPIPQSDYMVCRSVMLGAVDDILYKTQEVGKDNSGRHVHYGGTEGKHTGHVGGDGSHTHTDDAGEMEHVHDVLIGDKMRWLQAGDRVLVAWVTDEDACVIDLIFPATTVERELSDQYDIE